MLALAERAKRGGNITYQMLFLAQSNHIYSTPLCEGDKRTWFYILDKEHDVKAVEELVAFLEKDIKTPFETLLIVPAQKEKYRLQDLIGTKYLRDDNLEAALAAYQKIPDTWFAEGQSGYIIYDTYLQQDPFLLQHVSKAVPQKYSRKAFVQQLIQLKADAANPAKDRAKAQFAVANAYYNMTIQGNSWARMRYWSGSGDGAGVVFEKNSDADYYYAARAKKAYEAAAQLAGNTPQDKKFTALCLRMIVACELIGAEVARDGNGEIADEDFAKMPTNKLLKKEYAEYYKTLIGDCSGWSSFLR